jgi:hypothetical protein
MSTARIKLVVGDTRPQIYVQLKQPGNPTDIPLDVSTAQTVRMKVKPWGEDGVLFTMDGEPQPGTLEADLQTPDLSQYPIKGSGGRVMFPFLQGQLDIAPGRYRGEIEVTYGPNNIFTAFAPLEFELREDF